MLVKVLRYYHTVRYLKTSQIVARVFNIILRKVENRNRYSVKRFNYIPETRKVLNRLRAEYKRRAYVGQGVFTFLSCTLDTKSSWFPENASQLWIYNLHYFDYLFECPVSDGRSLLYDWLRNVPVGAKNAWHPYTVSLRICNWIWNYERILDGEAEKDKIEILNSLMNQLEYLADHLERDVLGNHLIENCKALIIGGLFFIDKNKVEKGLTILERQLQEQILPDGGHYERSPMYHCIVLEDLIAIVDGLKQTGYIVPDKLTEARDVMVKFLAAIADADGYPLLNDSAYNICLPPAEILRYVNCPYDKNAKRIHIFRHTGLYIYASDTMYFYFDFGILCPDFLPAHAHNDTLSFGVSFNGQEFVTDSGVYEYTAGKWRNWFRSGRAHNVVVIDKREPNDIWGSFRVGKRGRPVGFFYSEDTMTLSCSHTSYHDIGVKIKRSVRLYKEIPGVLIVDTIQSRRTHEFEEFIHIAPGYEGTSVISKDTIHCVELKKKGCVGTIISMYKLELSESWYASEFGKKVQRTCIAIQGRTTVPEEVISYMIVALPVVEAYEIFMKIQNGKSMTNEL